jgi:hypothetical protein
MLTRVACSVQSPNMLIMAAMYALCSEGTMTRRRVFQISPSAAGHPFDRVDITAHPTVTLLVLARGAAS